MLPVATSSEILSLALPRAIALYVTLEQFEALSGVNRGLKLERTAKGELIVNPPPAVNQDGVILVWQLN